jgi:hypothetical protein
MPKTFVTWLNKLCETFTAREYTVLDPAAHSDYDLVLEFFPL